MGNIEALLLLVICKGGGRKTVGSLSSLAALALLALAACAPNLGDKPEKWLEVELGNGVARLDRRT